ncbi:MAG: methyltransferase regulatory domain-containing protein [Gammaproteobacteria bacterium]
MSAVQHESEAANSYDAIPYESNPFPFTTPEYLASVAGLFGLEGADPARCRVLELGCASGGNLLPLAANFPDSHFVGIDASGAQVADGRAAITSYGLTNIELQCADILTWRHDGEPFDYVICHGVYSWVPDAVQTRILQLCRALTHPRSICYVSYNTYPGWHLRGSVREMMNYHARGFTDDRERIGQSRALLKFLVEAAPDEGAYGQLLREELEVLKDRDDSYLFHEHLEVNNTPLYFYQFAERMAAAGLRYLGEASLNSMLPHGYSPQIRETLARIAPDIIRHEQYLDFLRNRTFRRTLMCHEETELERDIAVGSIANYRVSAILRADPPAEGEEDEGPTFTHASGARISVQEPLERGVLEVLAREMPASVPVSALVTQAAAGVGASAEDPAVVQKVGSVVLECAANGIAELCRYPDRFALATDGRPRVHPFARWQLAKHKWAANQRHVRVEPPPMERELALLCDGTRDRAALESALGERVVSGELLMYLDGERLQAPDKVAELMPRAVERGLDSLAAHLLLVP